MTLTAEPISLRAARRWIAENHRHNEPPVGWLFGVALRDDGRLCAVGVASRPTARKSQNGTTMEIVRCCTDGTKNAPSMVYARLCRAAAALGYTKAITLTLASEPGTSLRAAGFTIEAEVPARDAWVYSGQGRTQTDLFGNDRRPPGPKLRWSRALT